MDAYNATLALIGELRTIVPAIARHDRELADRVAAMLWRMSHPSARA